MIVCGSFLLVWRRYQNKKIKCSWLLGFETTFHFPDMLGFRNPSHIRLESIHISTPFSFVGHSVSSLFECEQSSTMCYFTFLI